MKTPTLTLALGLFTWFAAASSRATAAEAEFVWNSQLGPNWSDETNWLGGVAPPLGGGADITLRFLNRDVGTFVSVNDLGAPFLLHALKFDNQQNLTISSATGNSLQLVGDGAIIKASGSRPASVASPMVLGTDVVRVEAAALSTLNLTGAISEAGGAREVVLAGDKGGVNTQITISGINSYTGGTTIDSGNVAILRETALGSGTVKVEGGTLTFGGTGKDFLVKNAFSLASDLVVVGGLSTTLSGVLASSSPNAGLLLRASADGYRSLPGTLTLTNVSTYTGATTIDFPANLSAVFDYTGRPLPSPNLVLAEQGRLVNTSGIEIRAGGTLTLKTGGGDDRLSDTTPVTLRNGNLILTSGDKLPDGQETIGRLAGSGYSTVQVSRQHTATRVQLTAAELQRLGRGTFEFRWDTLEGRSAGALANVFFTNPPVLTGGNGGGPQISVLPYAITAVGQVYGLATYDAATGVRPLNTSTEFTDLSHANQFVNVRVTLTPNYIDSRMVNALQIENSAFVGAYGGEGTLTIVSGALLVRGYSGSASPWATIGMRVDFKSAEGNVFTMVDLRLPYELRGTGGLTKSGPGNLYLLASNSITGPININSGLIMVAQNSGLGPDTSPIVINGQDAGLGAAEYKTPTINRNIEVRTGLAQLNTSIGGFGLTMNGTISGPGGLHIKGIYPVVLNGLNSYTGPTLLDGPVSIANDAAFGLGGELVFGNASKITLRAPWTTSRLIDLNSTATLDTGGYDSTWGGIVAGVGALLKTGSGKLILSRESPFSGSVSVQTGSLEISDSGSIRSSSVSVARGATLLLDDSDLYITDRLAPQTSISLTGGTFRIRGNPSSAVTHDFGTLAAGGGNVTVERTGTSPVLARFQTLSQSAVGTIIRGDALGAAADAPFTRLTFANSPLLSGGLIPGLYLQDAAVGGRTSLAAYDSTVDAAGPVGVRPLRDSELIGGNVVANPSNGGDTPLDANLLVQGTVTTSGGVNAVNSLTFAPGSRLTLGASQTLNVGKPGIFVKGPGLGAKVSGGTVDFGSARGLVYTEGDLSLSAGISGTAGFTKLGPGKLTVGPMQALTGGVVVAEGTLLINAAVNETSSLSVSAGATLRGEGSAGAASVSGRLDPGDGIGVLDLTALTMNSGSELVLELGSPTSYDQIRVGAGEVSLGQACELTLSLLNAYDPADWQDSFMILRKESLGRVSGYLQHGAGRLLFEGSTLPVGTQQFRISYVGGDGNDIVLTPVPEPTPSRLLLGAIAFFCAFCKRRRILKRNLPLLNIEAKVPIVSDRKVPCGPAYPAAPGDRRQGSVARRRAHPRRHLESLRKEVLRAEVRCPGRVDPLALRRHGDLPAAAGWHGRPEKP